MDHHIDRKIIIMRGWIRRRRARGIEPNADQVWERIRFNWPTLPQDLQEAVFQGSN